MLRSADQLKEFVLADPLCRELAAIAEGAGLTMALVGGCVRDWLLERPALDWDLVVAGDPRTLLAPLNPLIRGPLVTLDADFGVYRARLAGGLVIDLTRMQGDTLTGDLARRDLSINALACDLATGALIDPTNGLRDLADRVIRVPSRANLASDPLRLLRIFRFAATLDFTVVPETLAWAEELAPRLGEPAGERVWAELGKMLPAPGASRELMAMARIGLLRSIFPAVAGAEVAAAEAAERVATALDALPERLGAEGARAQDTLKTAWLAERPALAVVQSLGILTAALDPDAAREALAIEMHWSKREQGYGHAASQGATHIEALPTAPEPARAIYRVLRVSRNATPAAVLLALSSKASRDPGFDALCRDVLTAHWLRQDHPLPRLLDGNDLMRELAMAPGPRLATLLAGIDEAQALGEVASRAEALAWAARMDLTRE